MKYIPREELIFILDHLDEGDLCKLTIEKIFNQISIKRMGNL